MKLNNKGWGLTEMIIICCGILFCLLIIVYYVNVFRSTENKETTYKEPIKVPEKSPDVTPNPVDYEDYLILLQEKAISYVLTFDNLEEESTLYVPIADLINNNYVSKLEDCDGHVNVNKIMETYKASAYMTCSEFSNEE